MDFETIRQIENKAERQKKIQEYHQWLKEERIKEKTASRQEAYKIIYKLKNPIIERKTKGLCTTCGNKNNNKELNTCTKCLKTKRFYRNKNKKDFLTLRKL